MATNEQIARAIGLTYSGVSRIRTGGRIPSRATMQRIEVAFGWTVEAQTRAAINGEYVATLERYAHEKLDPITVSLPGDGEAVPS